jgi:hypothetical protein
MAMNYRAPEQNPVVISPFESSKIYPWIRLSQAQHGHFGINSIRSNRFKWQADASDVLSGAVYELVASPVVPGKFGID